MPRNYRSSIPKFTTEVIHKLFPDGTKEQAFYIVDGQQVGFRQWDDDGTLILDYGIRNGQKDGREYRYNRSHQPYEMTPYRNGQIHGTGIQWADDGSVLITYQLTNGVGLDLWCNSENGKLAEEAYWPDDRELGHVRNWNSDDRTIWEEYFFVRGQGYHGISREWNSKGNLKRGFPHFFIQGERVTKRRYLKALDEAPLLPPYRPEEDLPARNLPVEYSIQRRKK